MSPLSLEDDDHRLHRANHSNLNSRFCIFFLFSLRFDSSMRYVPLARGQILLECGIHAANGFVASLPEA